MSTAATTAATPRFGYIIIPHPHGGVFKAIGKHHTVSYISGPVASGLTDRSVICLWTADAGESTVSPHAHTLKPSSSEDPTDQVHVYLINPEKHALVQLGE
jgi:hypothetical protein